MSNRLHMSLLYGSPTTYCFKCHAFLDDPEKAHPRQHPTQPLRTIALCDPCFAPPPLSTLRIQSPRLQSCASCEEFFSLRDGPRRFCSEGCAKRPAQPATTDLSGCAVGSAEATLKRIASRKSCGPCDCEDYTNSGYCTMTFHVQSPPDAKSDTEAEDARNQLFEPRPKLSPRMLSPGL